MSRPVARAVFLLLLGLAPPALGLDTDLYARLLEAHTRKVDDTAGTRVDYPALRDSMDWARLVASLDASAPDKRAPREERLAFWINAYNVLAIETVRAHWPVDSIRDVGSLFTPVWDRPAGRVGGRAVTLGEIEHEVLRPMGDPRIHAAIVCASTSCPSLRREPYRADRIDEQLDSALRGFLRDPRKGLRVDAADGTLYLSRIFDWFAEDFEKRGGIPAALLPYMPADAAAFVREKGSDLSIEYFDYDWSVNVTLPAAR